MFGKKPSVVDVYCDLRDECGCKGCPKGSLKGRKIDPDDIAYREKEYCKRFKPLDGGTAGGDAVEIGVWK